MHRSHQYRHGGARSFFQETTTRTRMSKRSLNILNIFTNFCHSMKIGVVKKNSLQSERTPLVPIPYNKIALHLHEAAIALIFDDTQYNVLF